MLISLLTAVEELLNREPSRRLAVKAVARHVTGPVEGKGTVEGVMGTVEGLTGPRADVMGTVEGMGAVSAGLTALNTLCARGAMAHLETVALILLAAC